MHNYSLRFLKRDSMHKRGLRRHAMFVRLSVCLSVRQIRVDSVKMNKHIFTIFPLSGRHSMLVFPYQTSWQYSDGDPLPRVSLSNAGGVGENRDSRRISGYWIHDWWSANNNCNDPPCSLLQRPQRISESCLPQPAWTTTTKRREQNLIVCSGKSKRK